MTNQNKVLTDAEIETMIIIAGNLCDEIIFPVASYTSLEEYWLGSISQSVINDTKQGKNRLVIAK